MTAFTLRYITDVLIQSSLTGMGEQQLDVVLKDTNRKYITASFFPVIEWQHPDQLQSLRPQAQQDACSNPDHISAS